MIYKADDETLTTSCRTGASRIGIDDWFSILSRYVISAFPQTDVTMRNGCVPGTPSSYMIMCLGAYDPL